MSTPTLPPTSHRVAGGQVGAGAATVQPRICLVSSVPSTLWVFYRDLITTLTQHGFAVGVAASNGREARFIEQLPGVTFQAVDIHRRISPLTDALSIARLARILRRGRYDLVHAHTPKGGLIGMAAARLAGVRRRVYTVHGLPLETAAGAKRRLLATAERTSCRLATRLLAVSPSLRDRCIELGLCPPGKMGILGHGTACGVSLERFTQTPALLAAAAELRRSAGVPASAMVIGYVGRIVGDKGIDPLVEAFGRIAQRRPDVWLAVIGDPEPDRGALRAETLDTIERHPRIWRVPFADAIEPYYAAIDLLVLPSRREGFGYTLVEAAAMELPTIATRVTGCVNAVIDGETGLLVPPDDAPSLEAAMERLLADPDLRRRMGAAGRMMVVERFDSNQVIRAHLDLYRQMLDSS